MSGYRLKKKPTIKEVSNIVIELSKRLDSAVMMLSQLEKAFSLFVEMNKQNEAFNKFIDEKVKEYNGIDDDTERDGNIDKSNLQGDTDGESSGAKGVRQEVG